MILLLILTLVKYYEIIKILNEERMKYWRIISSIADENQKKLDSIWSEGKEIIYSSNWFKFTYEDWYPIRYS